MDRVALARMIDHTLLVPGATLPDVVDLCIEAGELGVHAVCVSPARLPLPSSLLPDGLGIVSVVGFPSGAHKSSTKATEAMQAIGDGATEIDMVIDLGSARAGEWDAVQADIGAVREAAPEPVLLKVIIESAALDSPDAVATACRVAEAAGADFVKTSTGSHPAGGATVEVVELMVQTVGDRLGVKASGGIRSAKEALAMVEAGATRIGTSASRQILEGL